MSEAPAPGFDGRAFVRTLAHNPGVYRMLDAQGTVLYVGKARDLQKRVGSYFMRPQLEPRIMMMVSRIAGVEVTVTRTEAEALLLENELIKSLKPRFNVLLRDDKSYPYIYVSTADEFPRMAFHRGARSAPGRYFGPFPNSYAVRESLNMLQKVFRVRQCEDSYFRARSRPCLQHQIGRCTAPCVGLVDTKTYGDDVRHLLMFLEGRTVAVIEEMVAAMDRASQALEFETAAQIRDRIAYMKQVQARQYVSPEEDNTDVLAVRLSDGLACVQAMFFRNGVSLGGRSFFPKVPPEADEGEVLEAFVSQYYAARPAPGVVLLSHAIENADLLASVLGERSGARVEIRHAQRGDRVKLIELALRTADQAIATERLSRETLTQRWTAVRELLGMPRELERIECFDISHTMGEATVAACVVFGPEGPVKAQYRRYNIEGVTGGDDFGAMRQALERRFRKVEGTAVNLPDLLLIDGGRGQVNAAIAALESAGVTGVEIVGIAKGPERKVGYEELVFGRDGHVLRPPAAHPGFRLLHQVRDEAHRFAITGHRARRQKARETSTLEQIPGVGARRRQLLLKHFGGLSGVVGAGVEELQQVKGIDRGLAERIYAALHG